MSKIKVTICNHRVDSPLYVWPGVWSIDLQAKENVLINWGTVSWNNTNQTIQSHSLWPLDHRAIQIKTFQTDYLDTEQLEYILNAQWQIKYETSYLGLS